ncbi:MAG: endonuclease/exonuclease/phosphatase family protein [Rhodobacteraceae bacterium]|nr:endonuclease/exonuclease/phosphatase family protein [Paracoccaceae bacterium]
MRLVSYNVEWFSALFDDAGRLFDDAGPSARYGVTRAAQTAALGHVFRALDADAVMVIEAPDESPRASACAALAHFAERFELRARRAAIGFANDTQQEIVLLYDPDALSVRHDPHETADAPRFDAVFGVDLDIDARRDPVRFSKPPLELAVETASGTSLRIIGAHLKSKAPHGARGRDAVMRQSIANRRKQLAQAIWLRARIDADLRDGHDLIVMGDLNDGPGLDEYESLFGRSSVEIVIGADPEAALFDPHARAALQRRLSASPSTARFYIKRPEHGGGRYLQALLDYVLVSPGLMAHAPRWRIWHPFDDPDCWADPALRGALLTASDHFPVAMDIDL